LAATTPRAAATSFEATLARVWRRRYEVRTDAGERIDCVLKGRESELACGDRVRVRRQAGGGVIEGHLPRSNLIYRSDAFREKLIAANVTQVIGVVAPDLPVDFELVDRWSIAAAAEGCRFLLVANKADLPGFEAWLPRLDPWRQLGHPTLALSAHGDVAPLRREVEGRRSVLVGQSGMGKSTLLNALAPEVGARTAAISAALGTGRHTTTATSLHWLPDDPAGGWIVDAPGMKAFGLAHLDPDAITRAFVEIAPFAGRCRFRDCRHDAEPGCAVQAAVQEGMVAPHRLRLLRAILAERAARARP
jgi:ribosome biogenesis GTPase